MNIMNIKHLSSDQDHLLPQKRNQKVQDTPAIYDKS
jgi:hypothetical protein